MKLALFASLLASAAAFAPADVSRTSSSALAMADFTNALGAQAPLGYFDPLGLTKDSTQEEFDHLRLVELKHGRIAMMAMVGYLTQESGLRFPGNIDYAGTSFASIPNGFKAFDSIPKEGLFQIGLFIFALEVGVMKDVNGTGDFVGDFRNGYIDFGWDKYDEATKLKKRAIELNNGRAAQMGILGLMVHEKLGNLGDILPGHA